MSGNSKDGAQNSTEDSGEGFGIKSTNPLARLDAAMESFVRVTEDFMIRTSYKTDKQTSKEISSLKSKRQALLSNIQVHKQKCLELKRGYAFLMAQLDDMIKSLDSIIAEEHLNG